MVWDFLKNLGRQKLNAVQAGVKSKVVGAQAKAQMKVAGKINKGIKGAQDKAVGAVKTKAGGQKDQAKEDKPQQKDDKMGLFGKKKQTESAPAMPAAEPEGASFGDKTQFIQVVEENEFKPVVGWLVALNGSLKGHDFRIRDGKNVIGTAADTDIVLTDQYMSARHAVIRHEEGMFVIVDLDSTNGTYVNDQRCSKEELIDNDRVRLGRTELKFKSLY
ncbi:MAG: FHA domain-containing protein [Deltaproteobacteria bacterium]|nr:FHA domain-containing protein [Deltaproteobacteria bacterium]